MLDIQETFHTEDACLYYLRRIRWPRGFVCPRCGSRYAWFIRTRNIFDCKICRAKTSFTAGTVFHKSRMPLVKWYKLIYNMAIGRFTKSVAEMQRDLAIKDYKTTWVMVNKVRRALANQDIKYCNLSLIKIYDSLFWPGWGMRKRRKKLKKTILCAVSLYRDHEDNNWVRFVNMRAAPDPSTKSIKDFMTRIGYGPRTKIGGRLFKEIRSDRWKSFNIATDENDHEHYKVAYSGYYLEFVLLDWISKFVSEIRAAVQEDHLRWPNNKLNAYLSYNCYTFNHRYWGKELFDQLLKSCSSTRPVTYLKLLKKL